MLYLFYGPETYLAKEQIGQISQKFDQVKKIDFTEQREEGVLLSLSAQLSQPDLFAKKQLFVFEDFLGNVSVSEERGWIELFSHAKRQTVIIWEKGQLRRKKTKLGQFLQKNAHVVELKSLRRYQLKDWVRRKASQLRSKLSTQPGQAIQEPAIEKLLSRHQNLWVLAAELEKLALFTSGRAITVLDVVKLSTPTTTESIFQLTDMVGQKKTFSALAKLSALLAACTDGHYILTMLVRQIRLLVLAKKGLLKDEHPFVQKKVLAQSKNWQLKQLKRAYQALLEAEWQARKGANLNAELFLLLGGRLYSDAEHLF